MAKTRSYGRIVSGKILGNYNLSFARNRQNESNLHQSSFSFFLNMAPPDVEGHKQLQTDWKTLDLEIDNKF